MARDIGGFGRLVAPKDGRDFHFRMRAAMPQVRAAIGAPKPRKRAYREGPILGQGQKPHCVAFSGKGFLSAAPLMQAGDYDTTHVYGECQRADEWPGENYDGTSVRALMKVLEARGDVKSYVWGQTVDEAIAWMNGGYGTIIIGTNWYSQMDEISADGFMQMPGALATPVGGHAYRVNWFDKTRKGLLIVNSWNHHWGIRRATGTLTGTAYMRVEDFARLLKEDGEVAAPVQRVKIKAVIE